MKDEKKEIQHHYKKFQRFESWQKLIYPKLNTKTKVAPDNQPPNPNLTSRDDHSSFCESIEFKDSYETVNNEDIAINSVANGIDHLKTSDTNGLVNFNKKVRSKSSRKKTRKTGASLMRPLVLISNKMTRTIRVDDKKKATSQTGQSVNDAELTVLTCEPKESRKDTSLKMHLVHDDELISLSKLPANFWDNMPSGFSRDLDFF